LFVHQRGLSTGPLQLTDIHINERYWIQLKARFHSCLATIELSSDGGTTLNPNNNNNNNTDDDHHHHRHNSQSKPRSRAN
ncbi:unnamed protein product, partial [Rotaria magnacalcarata]